MRMANSSGGAPVADAMNDCMDEDTETKPLGELLSESVERLVQSDALSFGVGPVLRRLILDVDEGTPDRAAFAVLPDLLDNFISPGQARTVDTVFASTLTNFGLDRIPASVAIWAHSTAQRIPPSFLRLRLLLIALVGSEQKARFQSALMLYDESLSLAAGLLESADEAAAIDLERAIDFALYVAHFFKRHRELLEWLVSKADSYLEHGGPNARRLQLTLLEAAEHLPSRSVRLTKEMNATFQAIADRCLEEFRPMQRWLVENTLTTARRLAEAAGQGDVVVQRWWSLVDWLAPTAEEVSPIDEAGRADSATDLHNALALLDQPPPGTDAKSVRTRAELVKRAIRDANLATIHDLEQHSFEFRVPFGAYDECIRYVRLGRTAPERLVRLYQVLYIPAVVALRAEVAQMLDGMLWPILFPTVALHQDGRNAGGGGEEFVHERELAKRVSMSARIRSDLVLKQLRRESLKADVLSVDDVVAAFRTRGLVGPFRVSILTAGVTHWLSGRPVEAVHLLLGELERMLRTLNEAQGGRFLAHKGSKTHVTALEPTLAAAEETYLGSDLAYLFRVILTEEGLNLRNGLYHGISSDPTESEADLVMMLLLHLLRFEVRRAGLDESTAGESATVDSVYRA